MKRNILRESDPRPLDNILVYAIASAESDLKICMQINQKLSINLTLDHHYEVSIKNKTISFRRYHFEFDEGIEKYFLFVNRNQANYLFPELKKIDYIFLIYSAGSLKHIEQLINELKKEPGFTVLHKMDPASLKSLKKISI